MDTTEACIFYDPRYRIPLEHKAPTDVEQAIRQRMSQDLFFYQLKSRAWEQCQPYLLDAKAAGSEEEKLQKGVDSSGVLDVVENAAIMLAERFQRDQDQLTKSAWQNEVLETLRKRWQQNMNEELRAIAAETHASFCQERKQPRKTDTGSDIQDASLEGSMAITQFAAVAEDGEASTRFLFDADDLVDFIVSATTPREKLAQIWGIISTPTAVPSFMQLQQKFHRLGFWNEQVESHGNSFTPAASPFLNRYIAQGQAILDRYSLSMARQYAQRGVPRCLRARFYRLLLGLPKNPTPADRLTYQRLKDHVDRFELLSDELYTIDVNLTNDDPRYFVFYELLDEVMMCFSRDVWVYEHSAHPTYQPIPTKDEAVREAMPHFPLNGVHPFKGLTNFAAPIAFLFGSGEEMYFVFREMYMRYWVKLTAISSRPDTLVSLLKLFEQLLCTAHPELMLHLQTLGFAPVKKAASWIQQGFAGMLEVEQVLLLWDRVLAFDDLTILPTLAAAVFTFRGAALLRADDAEEAARIMSNIMSLKVTPLLQAFLFPAVLDQP